MRSIASGSRPLSRQAHFRQLLGQAQRILVIVAHDDLVIVAHDDDLRLRNYLREIVRQFAVGCLIVIFSQYNEGQYGWHLSANQAPIISPLADPGAKAKADSSRSR
jgi:hypothetical protein